MKEIITMKGVSVTKSKPKLKDFNKNIMVITENNETKIIDLDTKKEYDMNKYHIGILESSTVMNKII